MQIGFIGLGNAVDKGIQFLAEVGISLVMVGKDQADRGEGETEGE